MIKLQKYELQNNILTNELLVLYIEKFWQEVFKPLTQNQDIHLMIMIKVHFASEGMGYRTLGHLRRVNFNDKE